jgi:hypothetical protein
MLEAHLLYVLHLHSRSTTGQKNIHTTATISPILTTAMTEDVQLINIGAPAAAAGRHATAMHCFEKVEFNRGALPVLLYCNNSPSHS